MSLLTWLLIGWGVADFVTLIGMGLYSLLMFDSSISEHLSRPQRFAMVAFGPVTILFAAFVIFPPTRMLIWMVNEVLFKK